MINYEAYKKAMNPEPDVGGKAVPKTKKAEIVEEVKDPATGVRFPIKPGITGEEAIKNWEKENGDIDEPTYIRKQRKEETGEI